MAGRKCSVGEHENVKRIMHSLVKAMFTMAREKKPTVVFVDEIDSLCASRDVGFVHHPHSSCFYWLMVVGR